MTVFHKAILAGAVEVARAERTNDLYRGVLLQRDGSVVAANSQIRYIAQPSSAKVYDFLSFAKAGTLVNDVSISWDQLTNLLKMVPKDQQFKGALEHIDMSNAEGNLINVVFNDGKGEGKFKLRSSEVSPVLSSWRKYFQELGVGMSGQQEFVFNRKRLNMVIDAIETSCKYDGEFSYIVQRPFSNGYIWRCLNELTGQLVLIAFIMPRVEEVVEHSDWEKNLFTRVKSLNGRRHYVVGS